MKQILKILFGSTILIQCYVYEKEQIIFLQWERSGVKPKLQYFCVSVFLFVKRKEHNNKQGCFEATLIM